MEAFLDWALYFSLCLTLVESTGNYNLFAGPKIGETRRYQVCSIPSQPCSHCFYCDPGVLADSTYEYKQDVLCNQYYKGKNFTEAMLPEELANGKIPVCNVGTVPGCGPPPQDHIQPALFWYCDPGYSSQPHSVYFSCALICNYTSTVAYQYYCNESLRWELLEVSNSSCLANVTSSVTEDVVHASTIKAGTAWIVPVIVGCTVFVVGLIVLVVCVIYRRRICRRCKKGGKHKEDVTVGNGNHAQNGFSITNNKIKVTNETEGIEMTPLMTGNENIQSSPQDDHQTSRKICDTDVSSGPEDTCASEIPLMKKHDNLINNVKHADKCIEKQNINGKKSSEPTSCIKINFKILNGKQTWKQCVAVNGVYEIPSGAEIRIMIDPNHAFGLLVKKEDGTRIQSGQYHFENSHFVMDSRTEDWSGKYCCKYTLLQSQEDKTELFEIKSLRKKNKK